MSKPEFFPPFHEGWWYQGVTYAGHSDYAVDFNRRTQGGGWLDDRGDPVLAAADGIVTAIKADEGRVVIQHSGGYQTEYVHMQPVRVHIGQKVQRGDLIGNIGEAGNAPNGTHLHHKHLRNGKPIRMTFEGKPVATSVLSDTQPASWKPPAPVMVQGPPPPRSCEDRLRDALRARDKAEDRAAALVVQVGALTEERDTALRRVKELEALPACDDVRDDAAQLEDIVSKVRALVTR